MLNEVLKYLDPKEGEYFIDCTLGGGSYTIAIAKKIKSKGKILSIDLDDIAIKNAKSKIKNAKLDNVILVQDNFKNLKNIIKEKWQNNLTKKFNGIVFDLGLSSAQLDDIDRGFSFKLDSPLNMSFGQSSKFENCNTEYIINKWKLNDLRKIFYEYGEEKFSNRIANEIIKKRKVKEIKTTWQLVEIIKNAVPQWYQHKKIHFATKIFQALRIAVNDELRVFEDSLNQALEMLNKDGRVVVITFHSLEDKIAKYIMREKTTIDIPINIPIMPNVAPDFELLHRKVILPSEEELKTNNRAHSAKLRAIKKI